MKIQFDCRHRIRAGTEETGDGGWEVCLDPPYNMKPGKCLVYSFGISYKWSFDDYMDQEKKCEVHAFDPSIGQDDFNRSANIHFHNLGLGGKNWTNAKKWKMYTLGSIVRLLGHKDRTLDYLKIDIEKSEWSSLEAMYQEGVLAQVKQLGIEFHDVPSNRKRVSIINRLYELGFRIYYTKQNFFQRKRSRLTRRTVYGCMESHFVNINFYKRNKKR
ncbi:methyltransferase-like protein 24 [Lingula anatina]|uniref:Methyltransferase-like protein 24 n=1 Tax=Lingula anatina TaxID=7574 RepID=A0A1S3K6T7_LINAN|nr:methyltransferase-like protein 24 [Lingula anatina]|eukprot:XP_013418144.1 methyltransferase-like protein 24 [Lingula anatina]